MILKNTFRIINSRLFKFVVGQDVDGRSTEISVHEEAVAQLSDMLRALMKGGVMTESQTACATWNHVGRETFERFAQFAYTGDYSVPKTETREKVEVSDFLLRPMSRMCW
jgi:hypothetical protein